MSQEDAIQFLMHFLNSLHEEILAVISLAPLPVTEEDGWKIQGTAGGRPVPLQEIPGAQSPLFDIFSTLVQAETIQGKRSRTISNDPFLLLPLEVRGHRTLDDALQAFVKEDIIEGDVSKKNRFVGFPRSLIIGFKRFEFDPQRGSQSKIQERIEYPEFLVPAEGRRYRLCAVVEHSGRSPESGHYFCYSRRFDGKWMKFDDATVSEVVGEAYLHAQAYLLLYNSTTSAPQP
jgi:ubiquitin C-terminal hydrolase